MPVYKVEDMAAISGLFAGWEETLIWSCLQGCMGVAYVDDAHSPRAAQVLVADFCFFAGQPSAELVAHRPPEHPSSFVLMVPQSRPWEEAIEAAWGQRAERCIRYATRKEPGAFDAEKLRAIVAGLRPPYRLKMIGEALYNTSRALDWACDLCGNFARYDDFKAHGLGVAALKDGELVAGASTYSYYNGGIEIEIDTRQDERRRGLGLACGARLILECLDRGLYPSWDAQNRGSLALAEKLGYKFDKEYPVYAVSGY